MCRSSECDLYWVSTQIFVRSESHQIGQDEVDQAVGAPEGNCGLGAVGREWHQALAFTARQDDGENGRVAHDPNIGPTASQ